MTPSRRYAAVFDGTLSDRAYQRFGPPPAGGRTGRLTGQPGDSPGRNFILPRLYPDSSPVGSAV